MTATFYWHDYETWGANPSRDKPCQFAGVRTDENLEPIGTPLVLYCRPVSDCVPHPLACLITGITPQQAQQKGCSEPEFFARIYQELMQPQTCGVGYNTLRFDDEVTRYGLYRNFYDPYEREWSNGNSRWDIIDMVRLTYALRPEKIQWPVREDGSPSFKLEALSQANGLLHDSAHDALSDVYATIALAQLIRKHYKDLFNYAYSLRDKKLVASLIDTANCKPMLHISSRFPASRGCAALVAPLMSHPLNKNSVICYDLSTDPKPLLQLSADEITERLYSRQDELPEGVERIPLKEIHLNKSPMVVTPKLLDDKAAQRLGINKARCEEHWQQLRFADLQQKLIDIYSHNPFPPNDDPEQQLYDGFIDNSDRKLLAMIRQAIPEQLGSFTEQLKDGRLQGLLFRYRARHYPQTLTVDEQQQWQEWRYKRLTDPDAGASLTLDDYFGCIDELAEVHGDKRELLEALYAYGDSLLG